MSVHGLSERQACEIMNLSRTTFRYAGKKEGDEPVRVALQDLARQKPTWGLPKMVDYLQQRRCGWNHKRIGRIYREMGLNLRKKPKKRLPAREPQPLVPPQSPNESWSLDFMSDSLESGQAFRVLNILDDFNREALWIEIDTSLPATTVIRILEVLVAWRGAPRQIRMDNGPELIARALEEWMREHNIKPAHIQPGKPAQNAYIERFNRTYREDVLDAYLFSSLEEVREITAAWLEDYNMVRPHDALGGLTPYQFAAQHA